MKDVAVVNVCQLVGYNEPRLSRRELAQQRVVDHDAFGRTDSSDVGVGGRRSAAGVDHVNRADLYSRAAGQLDHRAARWTGRQRSEAVEDRIDHERPSEGHQHAAQHDQRCRRNPPAARHLADQTNRNDRSRGRDQRRYACATGNVPGPLDPAAGRQAVVDRTDSHQRAQWQ